MPDREPILDRDFCDLAETWGVDPDLMQKVQLSAIDFEQETRRRVWIISGYRTKEEQRRLGRSGRPAAPDDVSTHRSCPATGVDISLGAGPTRTMRAIWGRIVVMNGLRWGGNDGCPPGTCDDIGIPFDWEHVDLGRRAPGR